MKRLFLIAISCLIGLPALSQEENREADSLRHAFGRQQVQPATQRASKYADTLDTGNPAVKVVLYDNGTYRFVKDPSVVADESVFSENWDTRSVNPYREQPDDLPDRFSIWIVDSLDSYACPNKTTPRSLFGYRHGRRHQGIDLPYPTGTPVPAAFDGKVRISDYVGGYGNLVVIRHANGLETFYGHLSKIYVQEDEWVNAGTIIGLGGSTGRSTGPHLHFETRYKGFAFDPEWLIDFESGTLRHRLFTLKRKYLSPASNYVPEDEQEEIDIIEGDTREAEEAKAKAEAERKALAAAQYHTIRQGDTLGKLAVRYHTSVRAICRLNKGLTERTVLQLGRKIRVK